MLMEKASVDINQNAAVPSSAPVTAGALYLAGKSEIYVPVYPLPPDGVFAPPFLIPNGKWTVVFELQVAADLVFYDVSYINQPQDVQRPTDDSPGKTTWTTTFDTSQVKGPNKLHCTIQLAPPSSNGPTHSGDPTIAVVQDPMGG
jgi:hypothetical protein